MAAVEAVAAAVSEAAADAPPVALAVAEGVAALLPVAVALSVGAHVGGALSGAKAEDGTCRVMGAALVTLPSSALHRVSLLRLLRMDTVVRLMRCGTASERGHTTMLPMAPSSAAEKLAQGAGASLKKKLLYTPSAALGQPLKE